MGFLASIMSGGMLGILGSVGAGVLNFFKQRQADQHALNVLAAQKDLIIATGNNQAMLEAFKTLQGSYESDKETYINAKFLSVDWFRGMQRVFVLIFLVVASTSLALWAFSKVGIGSLLTEGIAEHAIKETFRFTSMAIGYIFGSRELSKFVIKGR
mgnify:CR=1 FL=1